MLIANQLKNRLLSSPETCLKPHDFGLDTRPFLSRLAINSFDLQVHLNFDNHSRYLSVDRHELIWGDRSAEALIIHDISAEKTQFMALENRAYFDAMTNDYNRFYGMTILNEWTDPRPKTSFALAFLDLDNLKFINDNFGHGEGDNYIQTVAETFKIFPEGTVASRFGGDEFVLLIPNVNLDEADALLQKYMLALKSAESSPHINCVYNISYGIVAVEEGSNVTASEILSTADERMYEHKRAQKKLRKLPAGD